MKLWTGVLLTICSLALVFAMGIYAYKINHTTQHLMIEYTITTDSLGHVSKEARDLADSIINEMKRQEHLLEDKYEYVINQQSNAQDMLAVGGILLGIIVSIVGFFGYSTMQSIEEKATAIANEAANKAYEKKLKDLQDKRFKEYLNDNAKPEVDKQIKEAIISQTKDFTSTIDNLTSRIKNLEEDNQKSEKGSKIICTSEPTTVKPDPNPFY